VVGDDELPDVSTYPIGTSVTYNFAPAQGYREIALVVDDTGRASAGTVTMDHDHTIEIAADSDYVLNPDVAAIGDRLWSKVHDPNAPAAYSSFLNWYTAEASSRGADALDHLVDLEAYTRFDIARHSAVSGAFDRALGGVAFTLLSNGAATHYDYVTPQDYEPVRHSCASEQTQDSVTRRPLLEVLSIGV
jgi:hypothetical protein